MFGKCNDRQYVFIVFFGITFTFIFSTVNPQTSRADGSPAAIALTVIPPSPTTNQIELDLRGAVRNSSPTLQQVSISIYLDRVEPEDLLFETSPVVKPQSVQSFTLKTPARGKEGEHELILQARRGDKTEQVRQTLEIIPSSMRSMQTIQGAWAGIVHWSEQEGARWNDEIRKLTDEQWREQVRAMHDIGWNIIVIEEVFRNQMYSGQHNIEQDGYHGLAFYPSKLYPGRMEITAQDPIEAILTEADELGMSVFMGVGLYAWFDFSPGSLAWHKQVASELWEMYGCHPSFYGWYISAEVPGNIKLGGQTPEIVEQYRKDIVAFFKGFREHSHQFAPEKPIMLAPNSYFMKEAEQTWRGVMQNCDILCPFGFHRMPAEDVSGEEAAQWMQALCDSVNAHLWMDLEVFLFGPQSDLYPRPIDGLISDLYRFTNFEKILCFQYPGLLNAPWATRKPGGEDTVKLYRDYQRFLNQEFKIQHAAVGKPIQTVYSHSDIYPGFGSNPLSDGNISLTPDVKGAFWRGYLGDDLIGTIDFGIPLELEQIQIRFMESIESGIFLPTQIVFSISDDGVTFRDVATLSSSIDYTTKPDSYRVPDIYPFSINLQNTRARSIRIQAVNRGTIPDWHPAKGEKAWLFTDEAIVNPN